MKVKDYEKGRKQQIRGKERLSKCYERDGKTQGLERKTTFLKGF